MMLHNQSKTFFLELAMAFVRVVNCMKDKEYLISYARKAMIFYGLSLNVNDYWKEGQLNGELQDVISKY